MGPGPERCPTSNGHVNKAIGNFLTHRAANKVASCDGKMRPVSMARRIVPESLHASAGHLKRSKATNGREFHAASHRRVASNPSPESNHSYNPQAGRYDGWSVSSAGAAGPSQSTVRWLPPQKARPPLSNFIVDSECVRHIACRCGGRPCSRRRACQRPGRKCSSGAIRRGTRSPTTRNSA